MTSGIVKPAARTPADPPDPPRRVLLAVTGLKVAVVTETLHALAQRDPPWLADEVHVITTGDGAAPALAELSARPGSALSNLCLDLGLPQPRCDDSTVHVIANAAGPLPDLRSADDNRAAADTVLDVVRRLCADAEAQRHFSIAGGRKTLGFLLGYCASLLARPGDELSHVLVNPPFEFVPGFYFPPRMPLQLPFGDGTTVNTADARIDLAAVPFIRLRTLLPAPLLAEGISFTQTMAAVNGLWGQPALTLVLRRALHSGQRWLGVACVSGGLEARLPAKPFALYWLMACAAKHATAAGRTVNMECGLEALEAHYLPIYRALSGDTPRYRDEAARLRGFGGFDGDSFRSVLLNLNRALRDQLGERALEVYGPRAVGLRGDLGYLLGLPPEAISLLAPDNLGG